MLLRLGDKSVGICQQVTWENRRHSSKHPGASVSRKTLPARRKPAPDLLVATTSSGETVEHNGCVAGLSAPQWPKFGSCDGLDFGRAASHIRTMWRLFGSVLTVVLLAAAVEAEGASAGVAVEPLGSCGNASLAGQDEPGRRLPASSSRCRTGENVLAAYIRGGEFFRVLVPPGRYELLFASGSDWRGEAALFGPATQRFELDAPLDFQAKMSRKDGHLIDLRAPTDVGVRDFAFVSG